MIQNQRESSQETEEQEGWSRSTHQVLLCVVPQARARFSCMHLFTWHRERSKASSLFQGTLWLMRKQAVFLNYLPDFPRLEKCLRNLNIIRVTLTVKTWCLTLAHTTGPLKGLEYTSSKYGPWSLERVVDLGRSSHLATSAFPTLPETGHTNISDKTKNRSKDPHSRGVLPSSEKGTSIVGRQTQKNLNRVACWIFQFTVIAEITHPFWSHSNITVYFPESIQHFSVSSVLHLSLCEVPIFVLNILHEFLWSLYPCIKHTAWILTVPPNTFFFKTLLVMKSRLLPTNERKQIVIFVTITANMVSGTQLRWVDQKEALSRTVNLWPSLPNCSKRI